MSKIGGETGQDHVGTILLSDLCDNGYVFEIPEYQRGYRWQTSQVKALITDIVEFLGQDHLHGDDAYCLKTIVLKKKPEENHFIVVDGQQRLTTLRNLLHIWRQDGRYPFEFKYLFDLAKAKFSNLCIENTKKVAADFPDEGKEILKHLKKIRLIWYVLDETLGDPYGYEAYNRLNANKIPLEGSELIRALMLQPIGEGNVIGCLSRTEQVQIAAEWERIEARLRDDRFWFMFNKRKAVSYTRIDKLFEIIEDVESDSDGKAAYLKIEAGLVEATRERCTVEESWLRRSEFLRNKWNELLKVFWFLSDCYNDVELYHYLGFVRCVSDRKIKGLFDEYLKSPSGFKKWLINFIKEKIDLSDVLKSFDSLRYGDKRLLDLILLFNIETLNRRARVNQLTSTLEMERFPFQRFYETTWNIEHISSQTDNPMDGDYTDEQIEWAVESIIEYEGIVDKDVLERLRTWLSRMDKRKRVERVCSDLGFCLDNVIHVRGLDCDVEFGQVYRDFYAKSSIRTISDERKDHISNLTLLDEQTNKGYHNSIFPVKRRKIKEADEEIGRFVPPCTRNVFVKYYTNSPTSILCWQEEDADAYGGKIKEVFENIGGLYDVC